MSRLARLSLANRALVALAAVVVLIFGAVATLGIKQELMPSLGVPSANVTAVYPGVSAAIVEREVTEPVESAIAGLDGLSAQTSTTGNGQVSVQAEFEYGTDMDKAVTDIDKAVAQLSLPDGVEPQARTFSTDDIPVIGLAVAADTDKGALATRVDDVVVPELTAIDGVQDAQVTGARDERVVITVDEDEVAEAGLSARQVEQALQTNGVAIPGGELNTGDKTLTVETGTGYASADDLRNLELPTRGARGGTDLVKLSEVAEVKSQLEPATTITRTDGRDSLGISITKATDGNAVAISTAIKEKLPDLERAIGDGAKLTVVTDQAPSISQAVDGLVVEGAIGLGFAVLVILIFLLSVRSTVVTAVSIPLSLLIGVIGISLGGYSFNIFTLGALTVAVGRVVDDSIVVLENIKRHLGYGEKRRRAIVTAVREVAGAVTASTLTTVGVFLPIGLVGGMVGELFRPFALTVTVALLASLLVSLTIIPVLAYWFLRSEADTPDEAERVREKALVAERRNPLQRSYVPVLRWVTRHTVITLLAGSAALAGTVALVPRLETNLLPPFGENSFEVEQTLPAGTSLERTDAAADKVEDVLKDLDEIATYQVTVGGGGGGGGPRGGGGNSQSNQAQFSMTVREGTDNADFEAKLRGRLGGLTDAGELQVEQGSAGAGGSDDLEVVVQAPDDATLRTATEQVAAAMRATPDTRDVTSNLATARPKAEIEVDRGEAAAAGLSEAQIGQAVQEAFDGKEVTTITGAGGEQKVLLRPEAAPDSLDALRDLELAGARGTVTLAEVADVRQVARAAEITHIDGDRTASVTGKATGSDVGAVSTDLDGRLADLDLPDGASYSLGGVTEEQDEAFTQMILALVAAIAIVFIVMVAAFRSLVQPLILLVSVPFAATGAIGLLLLTGTPVGLPGLIGMLMLVGIVVTNAIVLIDLINQYRDQGMRVREAVVEGGRRRLRPILMTAIATICALLPMAFGVTEAGGFIGQPMAMVVIGGLVSSTVLTLILVPSLYVIVEGFKERWRDRRSVGQHARPGSEHPATLSATEPRSASETPRAAGPGDGRAAAPAGVSANATGAPVPRAVAAPVAVAERGALITGRVLDAAGRPAEALLTLVDLAGGQLDQASTGVAGEYRLIRPSGASCLIICMPLGGGQPPDAIVITADEDPAIRDIHLRDAAQ